MKNQKGFIQIPLLIAIIAGVLVISGASYFGVKQYHNYQAKQTEEKRLAQETDRARQEKEKQTQDLILAQQKALEETNKELKKVKESQSIINNTDQETKGNVSSISASDLSLYLSGVVGVSCGNISGSGSLYNNNGQYSVLTNWHVVSRPNSDGSCVVTPNKENGELIGFYKIFPYQTIKRWNEITDIALVELNQMRSCDASGSNCLDWPPKASLNYFLTSLRNCGNKMPVGSPVSVIGYPAFGVKGYTFQDLRGSESARIVTNGIISGYDTTVEQPIGKLPYPNYFVSAKIDSGNSGGIALSKDSSGLCVLGVPTWLTIGNYETQGLVQNIWNVMYKP